MSSSIFRGIIQHMAFITAIEKIVGTTFYRFQFRLDTKLNLKAGDSIALNGVCFTVRNYEELTFEVVVWQDTWRLTNFSLLDVGDRVNLELPHSEGHRDINQCERNNQRFMRR